MLSLYSRISYPTSLERLRTSSSTAAIRRSISFTSRTMNSYSSFPLLLSSLPRCFSQSCAPVEMAER